MLQFYFTESINMMISLSKKQRALLFPYNALKQHVFLEKAKELYRNQLQLLYSDEEFLGQIINDYQNQQVLKCKNRLNSQK